MERPDETWHRLRDWTAGQRDSERLAAQVLLAAGYNDIDPIHPLGGRDGGKDALATKDGDTWVMAVYFPLGQVTYSKLEKKFKDDYAGVASNGAHGMAFVTNQRVTDTERKALKASVDGPTDLFHIERLVTYLDSPAMEGVRKRLLFIDRDELDETTDAELAALELRLRTTLAEQFRFLSMRGLPRSLRHGEPRLPMDEVFVPMRLLLPVRNRVPDVLDELPYRERRVLELRLGLGGERGRTLEELGRAFNVTRERIRQIEAVSLRKVSSLLASSSEMSALNLALDMRATVELLRERHDGVPALELAGTGRLVVLGGPGSGKSTLMRYLTWAMASGRCTGLLSELLPVRTTARALSGALQGGSDVPTALTRCAGEMGPVVRGALNSGRALVMVDGLDEITDPRAALEVHEALGRMIGDPAYSSIPMLFTSRIVGFHPEGPLAALPALTLAPLSTEETERFLLAWFAQVDGADAAAKTRSLLTRLSRDARMAELASSPLLLTVLALLHSRGRQLFNERARLYASATETLVETWPALARGADLSLETIPPLLAPLAERAFLAPPTMGIADDEVVEVLTGSWHRLFGGSRVAARGETRALLASIERDSGLLSVTGYDEDGRAVWDFLHRSFAEYLVARQRADQYLDGGPDLLEIAGDEGWREVLLMAVGELGRRDPGAVAHLLVRLRKLDRLPLGAKLLTDLRLCLSVLGRDVPCDLPTARALIEDGVERWRTSPVLPLVEDLERLLAALADTRYDALLAEAAAAGNLPPAAAVTLGTHLAPEHREDLLGPLLRNPASTLMRQRGCCSCPRRHASRGTTWSVDFPSSMDRTESLW